MGDTRVLRARLNAVIRREGGRSLTVKRGVTTAHAGSEIALSHPHLWEKIAVDFPVEGAELTDAAVESAGTAHTEALRSILAGLTERGYELVAKSREDVPAQLVALVFSAIDHPRVRCAGDCGVAAPHAHVVDAAGGDPGEAGPDDAITQGAAAGGEQDDVDPGTKEGRAAIREWAAEHGYEVSSSGPIRQEVLDAWAEAQDGRG